MTGRAAKASALLRIAFVTKTVTANTRHVASGLSRFAKPSNGFILREFFLDPSAKELPAAFESWSPDGVVGLVSDDEVEIISALTAGNRPFVNTARMAPGPGRGIVLGDAEEVYRAVHDHFQKLGIVEIVQFGMGESPGTFGTREQYRHFVDAQGLAFHSVVVPNPKELDDYTKYDKITLADETVAKWLRGLPKPVGVFSQQSGAGAYLCRMCELLNIAVPTSVAVIGTDSFDVSLSTRPPVTSVQIPTYAIGYEAGKLVAALLKGEPAPAEIIRVSGAQLIVRESTCKTRAAGCDIDAALAFILNHACEEIRVNDVVSHTQGVSRMTFHKKFVETVGITPGEAIRAQQLSEARRLLSETRLSLGTVAGMCGFEDYIHFYRVFREVEGLGPRDFRRTTQRAWRS